MTRSWFVRFALMILTTLAVFVVAQGITTIRRDDTTWALASGVVTAVLALVAYRYATRRIEKRRPTELSRPQWLVPGALAGGALFGLVMLVIWLLGGVGTVTFNSWIGLAAMTSIMINVAVIEETLFRGVLLRMVAERFGGWAALAVSAPLFGLPHLLNHGTDVIGALSITVCAGLLLGGAYLATGSLWLPIGLHLGLNFAESAVFGIVTVDSPLPDFSLYNTVLAGSDLVTGGVGGPEASLVTLTVLTVPAVALIWYAAATGRMRRTPVSTPTESRPLTNVAR
ncbi:CPBP family intramembrane glutamic endopeptidase [Micromonospora sp. NPDC049175]|uniref:CPBP family intramembrane glutamic endopeptidase n=1 Tax=unclassified Micromonospora TaxID=2617518 RepID=UPI0037206C21